LSTNQGRRGWLREAKRQLDEERAKQARPIPRSRPVRLKEAKRRLEEELWVESRANAAYEAYRVHGRASDGKRLGASPTPYTPPEVPVGKMNLTDPDSRLLKATRGYIQGYNAQAAVAENQIVIAAEVMVDPGDFGHLEPIVNAAQSELEEAGVNETPRVLLADAGYWHQVQMENIINRGIQVLIPPDAGKRKGTRPGWDGGAHAHMRRVLQSDLGNALYRKRQAMIEPVYGQTKFNRRIDRFQRRGRAAARSEWRLITATHNLLKLHRHQIAAAGA
jgi:Transposase DDE domain